MVDAKEYKVPDIQIASFTIEILNDEQKPLAGVGFTVYVDGVEMSAETDTNGIIKVPRPKSGIKLSLANEEISTATEESTKPVEESETSAPLESQEAPKETPSTVGAPEISSKSEESAQVVIFPSGESLPIVTGLDGPEEEYYDPTNSGNPLLDTSEHNRSKRLSKNFTVDELAKSGTTKFYMARIDPKLVECLQAIRDRLGKTISVRSSYRSYKYNVEIYKKRGEKPTESQHSSGKAVDIQIVGLTGLEIAKAAIDACGCNIGVGIAANYAHIDVRGRFAKWTYEKDKDRNAQILKEITDYHRERCR